MCVKIIKSATKTFDSLTEAYGNALQRIMVWHIDFKEVQENVEDKPCSRRLIWRWFSWFKESKGRGIGFFNQTTEEKFHILCNATWSLNTYILLGTLPPIQHSLYSCVKWNHCDRVFKMTRSYWPVSLQPPDASIPRDVKLQPLQPSCKGPIPGLDS